MYKNKIVKLIKKIYPRYGLKYDDIILASYPKSGNTWFRFIWLNIVSLIDLEGEQVDFHIVNGPLNAEYDSHSYGSIKYNCLSRLVKTHMKYDKRFEENRSIYIVRNPGDVMVSFYEYQKAHNTNKPFTNNLSTFINSPEFGIDKWCKHVQSWSYQSEIITKYETLKTDTFNEVKKIINQLNLSENIQDLVIEKAVRRSSFNSMRKIEEMKGRPNMENKFKEDYKFTRKGSTGEWREKINGNDILLIRNKLKEYNLDNLYKI